MGVASFFKPTWGKIILFVILMGGVNYYVIMHSIIPDIRHLAGWPLKFWPVGYSFILNPAPVNFSPVNFAIDVAFWYAVAAIIVVCGAPKRTKESGA